MISYSKLTSLGIKNWVLKFAFTYLSVGRNNDDHLVQVELVSGEVFVFGIQGGKVGRGLVVHNVKVGVRV